MIKMVKKLDRRMFKKEGEELQQWLVFKSRGSKTQIKTKYNRKEKHKSKEY